MRKYCLRQIAAAGGCRVNGATSRRDPSAGSPACGVPAHSGEPLGDGRSAAAERQEKEDAAHATAAPLRGERRDDEPRDRVINRASARRGGAASPDGSAGSAAKVVRPWRIVAA